MAKANFEKRPIIIILWLLLVAFIWYLLRPKKTTTKDDVAKFYNISKPTLSKWIRYFHPNISPLQWKKKKRLTDDEVKFIVNLFGDNITFVLTKGDICKKAECSYKTLAENVKKNLIKIGISQEAWNTCSVFPPSISCKILDAVGDLSYDAFEIQEQEKDNSIAL